MLQVEGRNPVYEMLKTTKPAKVLISEKSREDPKIQQIIDQARKQRILIEFVEASELNRISETRRHQGVIALMKTPRQASIDQVLSAEGDLCVLLLDRVQDPMNLGSILRTSEATGVNGIVVPKKGGVGITPTVLRASMGAGLRVPIIRASLYQAVKLLKGEGAKIVGVDPTGDVEYYDERLMGSLALILGGEGRGISPTLLGKCDSVVRIPMAGNIESLNVGVAAAVVLYERIRQQERKG
ncbi:23S rRNA (guanosine(2251)-2'-O)-methyltransferase RlmB [Candidatus Bathyarchaeota archaeon]|nr:MAG: 23S rRNA (guanosine(2251)-2'-O)-methyltransferase RlmB [Candidatus Bathyarchaeota archaeon]